MFHKIFDNNLVVIRKSKVSSNLNNMYLNIDTLKFVFWNLVKF